MPTTITSEDVLGGGDKTYELTGGGHSHQFTILADEFLQLAAGETITVTSTNDLNHTHDIVIGGCLALSNGLFGGW